MICTLCLKEDYNYSIRIGICPECQKDIKEEWELRFENDKKKKMNEKKKEFSSFIIKKRNVLKIKI
jgi:hypothetical protein